MAEPASVIRKSAVVAASSAGPSLTQFITSVSKWVSRKTMAPRDRAT
jgi:hypothetical protein